MRTDLDSQAMQQAEREAFDAWYAMNWPMLAALIREGKALDPEAYAERSLLWEAWQAACRETVEACAKLVDAIGYGQETSQGADVCFDCADAIRAMLKVE